ncbi:hypothetical protein SAMN04487820_105216 [Actinopolyspora mzabensis]|uniref:Uncharacterized protein n=1 Tax=Actinopolyspora mzabensis TaxID=995066 RepID=A0A1G8ZYX2_ACTMZ|nr:hypothetical protein [Actinopolyspora mzabensis]SDK20306.1 hypothetical protein SAMN04487820_105216 [Actinopolyspora mzabensis]
MLDPQEEAAVAEQFGVARAQVRRDHLISHLLAAISDRLADEVLFFGGVAFFRTLTPRGLRHVMTEPMSARSSMLACEQGAGAQSSLAASHRDSFPLRWSIAVTRTKRFRRGEYERDSVGANLRANGSIQKTWALYRLVV